MKLRMAFAGAAIVATLALGGCNKTENTNVTANETVVADDNMMDGNDAANVAANVMDNSSNGGDPMKGDLTHP